MRLAEAFRGKHPVVLGLLLLAAVFLCAWLGLTFFLSLLPDHGQGQDFFSTGSGKIGVVEVKGVITSAEKTIQDLTEFRQNPRVRAIVLRIDSPGGAVGASQEIFEEVKKTNAVKPVVASMGSVAASGGYYAALGASKIVASPGTLTGSIGVIIKFPNLTEIFDKIGYHSETIKSGKLKDIGAANRPMTPEERALLQGIIDNVYGQFVDAVVRRRQLPRDKVLKLADGRIFSGEQALQDGLIDQYGNFTDAVAAAARLAGMKNTQPPLVYNRDREFSLLHLLLGGSGESRLQGLAPLYPTLAYEMNFKP